MTSHLAVWPPGEVVMFSLFRREASLPASLPSDAPAASVRPRVSSAPFADDAIAQPSEPMPSEATACELPPESLSPLDGPSPGDDALLALP